MNLSNIIKYFESDTVEQDFSQVQDRRYMLRGFASKVAVASVPFVAASLMSKNAHAQGKQSIIAVLNFLLKPHYIAQQMYDFVVNNNDDSYFPGNFKENFNKVINYNKEQIKVLEGIIGDLGGTVEFIDSANIDLTAGAGNNRGPLAGKYDDFEVFLILAHMLSDATVRIYKDQVTEVLSDNESVRAIMNIHSVKAREASFFRYWRRFWYATDIEAWVTGTNSNSTIPFVQNAYNGEGVIIQNNITITNINGYGISEETATQAFDEPFDRPLAESFINSFLNIED